MYYERLVYDLNIAADKWEKENPFIPTGALRVHDALRAAATALSEAEPIQHGCWIDKGTYRLCSICNMAYRKEIEDYYKHMAQNNMKINYCPYCGAKMNEETKNE